jgi:hypothetical protein
MKRSVADLLTGETPVDRVLEEHLDDVLAVHMLFLDLAFLGLFEVASLTHMVEGSEAKMVFSINHKF